jgi:hypothetical protein
MEAAMPKRPRRAQLRRSSTTLVGAPAAGRKALPGRVLLARRKLGTTCFCGEINLWRELVEVRCYDFAGASYELVLPGHMLAELAAIVQGAVDAMDHELHRMVDATLVELVPPRVLPDGSRLIAHGVVGPTGGLPVGLAIGHYQIGGDHTVEPVVIAGAEQLIGTHKAGAAALAGLFAEAVAAASSPVGRA